MFKKFSVIFLVLLITACETILPTGRNNISMRGGSYDQNTFPISQSGIFSNESSFKVAMLLPMSGKSASYGQGLKNAAMMAIEDTGNPNLVVQFYDTQSTPQGAERVAREALENGSRLILGPLTAEEVSVVGSMAKRRGIPVISYSTSPNVLQEGIYTLGLLGSEQIDRVVSYAAGKGRSRLAVLVPDNTAGINMARAAMNAAAQNGAKVVKIGFYPPETIDFANIVKQLTDYESRSAEINKRKNQLSALAKKGNIAAARELKKLKTTYTSGIVDFDAVLIPESGNRLKSAASMFGYYDISYPDVLFLGTSVWENTALNKETTLYHGIYPVISRVHNDYFNRKYENYFGEKPNSLYSFAYDGVALASALSRKDQQYLEQNITDNEGYIGINGTFRIFSDGTNQHSLDILEVTKDGPKIVNTASKTFDTLPTAYTYKEYLSELPQIYGKDANTAYTLLRR